MKVEKAEKKATTLMENASVSAPPSSPRTDVSFLRV